MQTVDFETVARGKQGILLNAIDGTRHVGNSLTEYHAAKKAIFGARKLGAERQLKAVREALKPCNVVTSLATYQGVQRVRVYVPTKQIELYL